MTFRRVVDATTDVPARWTAYARARPRRARLRDARRIESEDEDSGRRARRGRGSRRPAARRARRGGVVGAAAARDAMTRLETIRVAREARLVGRVALRLRREAFDAYRDVVRRDRGLRYRLYKLLKRWNRLNVAPAFDAWKSAARDSKRRGEAFRIVARRFARFQAARAFAAWVDFADDARRDARRARVAAKFFLRLASRRDRNARESAFHEWRTLANASRRVRATCQRVSARARRGATRDAWDEWRVRPVGVVRGVMDAAWRRRARKADRLMRRVLGRAHLDAFASWVDAFRYRQSVRRFLDVGEMRARRNASSTPSPSGVARRETRVSSKRSAISRRCARGADGPFARSARGAWRWRMRFSARDWQNCGRRARGLFAPGDAFSAWRLRADRRTRLLDVAERRVAHVVASRRFARGARCTAKTRRRVEGKLSPRTPWRVSRSRVRRRLRRVARKREDVARASSSARKNAGRWRLSRVGSAFQRWIEAVEEAARLRRLVARRRSRVRTRRRRGVPSVDRRAPRRRRRRRVETRSATIRREASKPRRSRRVQGVGRRHRAVQEGAPRGREDRREMVAVALRKPSRVGSSRRGSAEERRGGEDRREMVAWRSPKPSVLGSSRRGSAEGAPRGEKIAARWSRLALLTCWAHRVEDPEGAPRGGEIAAGRFALAEAFRVAHPSRICGGRRVVRRSPRESRWRSQKPPCWLIASRICGGAPRGGRSLRDGRVWRSRKPSRVGLIASRICGGSAAWWRRSPRDGRVWPRMLAQDAPRKQDGASGSCRRAAWRVRDRVCAGLRREARTRGRRSGIVERSKRCSVGGVSVAGSAFQRWIEAVEEARVETIGGKAPPSGRAARAFHVDRRARDAGRRRVEARARRFAARLRNRDGGRVRGPTPSRSEGAAGGRSPRFVRSPRPSHVGSIASRRSKRRRVADKIARRWSRLRLASAFDCWCTGAASPRRDFGSPRRCSPRRLFAVGGTSYPRDAATLARFVASRVCSRVSPTEPSRDASPVGSTRRRIVRVFVSRRLESRVDEFAASSVFSRWRDFVDEERRVKKLFAKCARRVAVRARRRRSIVGGNQRARRAQTPRETRGGASRRSRARHRGSRRSSIRVARAFGMARTRQGTRPRTKSPRQTRIALASSRDGVRVRGLARVVRDARPGTPRRRSRRRDDENRLCSRGVAAMARIHPRATRRRRANGDASSILSRDDDARARRRVPRMARQGGGSTKGASRREENRGAMDAIGRLGRVRDVGGRRRRRRETPRRRA